MDKLEPPRSLSVDWNLAENWKKFKQRFELYLGASGAVDKEDKIEAWLFLHVIGEDALDVYNNFKCENDGDNMKLKVILEKFDQYYNQKKSGIWETQIFYVYAKTRWKNWCIHKWIEKKSWNAWN